MGEHIDIVWLSINIHNKSRQRIRTRVTALSVIESMRPKQRRRRCSPIPVLAAEEVQELMDLFAAWKVFRENIRWVNFASHLLHCDRSCPDLLLEPQRVCLQVPYLS